MQLANVNVEQSVARRKYAEYLKAVKQRHSKEYETLKRAYRAIIQGQTVIDLVAAMKQGGFDALGRPRFAVIQADAKLCWFRADSRSMIFSQKDSVWRTYQKTSVTIPRLPFGEIKITDRRCRAVVPTIPPSLLPDGDLSKYHILWEAEWEQMPVDPVLLKHLGGYLYVVLAQWDLTPLEQSMLYGRLPK